MTEPAQRCVSPLVLTVLSCLAKGNITQLLTQLQVGLGQGSKNMQSWNFAALVEDTHITES